MNKLLNLFPDREFIFLDGGMGTMLQKEIDDIGKVPEVLNITHPEIIQKIQRAYVEAGSDIINTCTFGVNPYKIEGCGYTAGRADPRRRRQREEGGGWHSDQGRPGYRAFRPAAGAQRQRHL